MHTKHGTHTDPPLDRVFRLCSNGIRRRALVHLSAQPDGRLTLQELRLALLGDDRVDVSDGDRLEIALYHVHLPALVDAGVVTVTTDDEQSAVHYTGDHRVEALLESVESFT